MQALPLTDLSCGSGFAAFRGLGHVLAISRSLATFSSTESATSGPPPTNGFDSPAPSDPMQEDTPPGEKGSADAEMGGATPREVRWTGKVGDQLRRREECLFETVGCVKSRFLGVAAFSIRSVVRRRASRAFFTALTQAVTPYSVMIDCSRNGVLKVESVKTLLRHLALMGTNMLQVRHGVCRRIFGTPLTIHMRSQLYCEDTYTIPGEPFFGASACLGSTWGLG